MADSSLSTRAGTGAARISRWAHAALLALALAAACVACDKGPAQKAGEKVDNAIDTLTGKGPAEKAGEKIDKAVDALKK